MERLVPKEMVMDEVLAALDIAERMRQAAMDVDDMSVARGLLGAALAYSVLAKSSPLEVKLEHMQEILEIAFSIVSRAEDEANDHVLQ